MTIHPSNSTRSFSGWGQIHSSANRYVAPCSTDQLASYMRQDSDESLVVHGCGRSYGDVATSSAGTVVWTRELDRIHSFDRDNGALVCDAGVTIDQIVSFAVDQGYVPAVSPGTGFVSVGGAIANDVHGKNHDRDGSFCDHVHWLELMTGDGTILRVSEAENAELFRATVGGIGLTGIITRVSLSLARVSSTAIRVSESRCVNLDEFIDKLEAHRASAKYSVGWIDALATGDALGRGILEIGEPSENDIGTRDGRPLTVPFNFPGGALNRLTVKAFNELYFRRIPASGRQRTMSYRRFTYPLDSLHKWYRIYGRRGFYQFQCVLPDHRARTGLREILETVSQAGCASFLAVLKTLGSSSKGMLSFPARGFTLALDLPNKPGVLELLGRLEVLVRAYEGRIYLAKDGAMSPESFRAMYPEASAFEAVLKNVDPRQRFCSDMSRRLRIRNT